MAHELTIRKNGMVEHAYRGTVGWHGLGQEIPADADLDTIIRLGGLEWEVDRAYVRYTTRGGVEQVDKSRVVTYRADTKDPLGVVSASYQPVQPREVAEFFRDIMEIETLGTLRGGKRVWAMARVGADQPVTPGDFVAPYVLVSTSMDGSLATTIKFVTVRVVCANTLRMAFNADNRTVFAIRHSTVFDVPTARARVAQASASFAEWLTGAQALAAKQVSAAQAKAVLATLFAKAVQQAAQAQPVGQANVPQAPAPVVVAPKVTKAEQEILALFTNGSMIGASLPGMAGTAWGLLNSITEYVDHGAKGSKVSVENRFDSAQWGVGDKLKSQAAELLAAL